MVKDVLTKYGIIGVQALKQDVQKVSATGETEDSIRFEVSQEGTVTTLFILARAFFSTLETGRGPRKSSEQGNFLDGMWEYMQARGIGADLPEKKRRQLARFLTLKINREGDKTFKQGGRIVYSPTLTKFINELRAAVKKDLFGMYVKDVMSVVKDGNNNT